MHACMLSRFCCVWLFATLWTVASQGPWDSRQESWSGLPLPSPGDLPDPGIESRSPVLQKISSWLRLSWSCDHSPRARHPGMWSQVGLRKHHCSPPGSAVPGILQARILEWIAISFSNAWKWKVKVKYHYEQSYWRWWNSSWAISNPERWCCESAALNTPANLENSAVATGLEKVSFCSNPKERQCQRMLKLPHNCTHLIRYKVMLKILQARLQ